MASWRTFVAGVIKPGQPKTAVATLGMGLLDVPHSQPGVPAPRTALESFCQIGLFGLPVMDIILTVAFLLAQFSPG